jgi:hypothetical protein
MVTWRGVAAACAAAVMLSATVLSQQKPPAQQKYNDAQVREIQAIVKLLDAVAAGQPAPDDLSLRWARADVLKGQNSFLYVPFTVTADAAKVVSGPISVYWRVVAKADPSAAATEAPAADRGDAYAKPAGYAYEYLTSSALPAAQGGLTRINRSFTVPAGSYDVYVVVKEPTSTQRNAPAPKVSVLRQSFDVPDFWNSELNTSTVIVTDRVDPLPAPLTPQQQIERPYALGAREIVPSLDHRFDKQTQMTMFLLIYNPRTDSANKPDVTVEYNFYTRQSAGEKFFNKTPPQQLNANTLDPKFDLALGHQLPSGQTVPLSVFPPGDYRLEVKVTDNLASTSVTRDVNFTVAGS